MLEPLFNHVAGLKTQTQVFSSEICEILKNTYFEEQNMRTTASAYHEPCLTYHDKSWHIMTNNSTLENIDYVF